MNQCLLVGKVKELPELKETATGHKVASILIEVDRNFMNSEGIYEKDIFKVDLWRSLAEQTCSIAKIGSLLGIKGRFVSKNYTNEENTTYYNADIIAEKVSFLQV